MNLANYPYNLLLMLWRELLVITLFDAHVFLTTKIRKFAPKREISPQIRRSAVFVKSRCNFVSSSLRRKLLCCIIEEIILATTTHQQFWPISAGWHQPTGQSLYWLKNNAQVFPGEISSFTSFVKRHRKLWFLNIPDHEPLFVHLLFLGPQLYVASNFPPNQRENIMQNDEWMTLNNFTANLLRQFNHQIIFFDNSLPLSLSPHNKPTLTDCRFTNCYTRKTTLIRLQYHRFPVLSLKPD